MERNKACMRERGANKFVRDVNEAMHLGTFARAYFQRLIKQYSPVRFISLMAHLCLHVRILKAYRRLKGECIPALLSEFFVHYWEVLIAAVDKNALFNF